MCALSCRNSTSDHTPVVFHTAHDFTRGWVLLVSTCIAHVARQGVGEAAPRIYTRTHARTHAHIHTHTRTPRACHLTGSWSIHSMTTPFYSAPQPRSTLLPNPVSSAPQPTTTPSTLPPNPPRIRTTQKVLPRGSKGYAFLLVSCFCDCGCGLYGIQTMHTF